MDNLLNLPKDKELLLVAHSGTFHADDVFSTAVLSIILEKYGYKFKILRTRDPELINKADIAYDVGRVYNFEKLRFDHHQVDASLQRDGIPYSSFGLIWKHFGPILCEGDEKLWGEIENNLVRPIDCSDNGISTYDKKFDFGPITLDWVFSSFNPTRIEKENGEEYNYELFFKAVNIAKEYFQRVYASKKQLIEDTKIVLDIYNNTIDKRLIVLDKVYDYTEAVHDKTDILIVIKGESGSWSAKAQRENKDDFKTRVNYPESWRGLEGKELEVVTGVDGSVFCHKAGFLCVANSKEAAIKLAEIAISKKST